MLNTVVAIPGMDCPECVDLVRNATAKFPGVTAHVDLAAKRVTLEHAVPIDFAGWKGAIEALGPKYRVVAP
jgi:hypothetical protein